MPHESEEIMEWLKLLPVQLKYKGKGLPNISAQVLLFLIKHCRASDYLMGQQQATFLGKYDYHAPSVAQSLATSNGTIYMFSTDWREDGSN